MTGWEVFRVEISMARSTINIEVPLLILILVGFSHLFSFYFLDQLSLLLKGTVVAPPDKFGNVTVCSLLPNCL